MMLTKDFFKANPTHSQNDLRQYSSDQNSFETEFNALDLHVVEMLNAIAA